VMHTRLKSMHLKWQVDAIEVCNKLCFLREVQVHCFQLHPQVLRIKDSKEGITRWFHKMRFVYKKLIIFHTTSASSGVQIYFFFFFLQILSQFMKPLSDTHLRYFNMIHLVPPPLFLQ
jgi:hypothetical protein